MEEATHYATLNVATSSGAAAIRDAYTTLAKRYHPDVGGDPFRWANIQSAYNILMDPESRAEYDSWFEEEGEDGEDSESGDGSNGMADPWFDELSPFDLHAELSVTASGADGDAIVGGEARVLSRYYDQATATWPAARWATRFLNGEFDDDDENEVRHHDDDDDDDGDGEEEAKKKASDADRKGTTPAATARYEHAVGLIHRFRRASLAYVVLHDPARRSIYATNGYDGTRLSESYQEESVFEMDARSIRERFFAGEGDEMVSA